MTPSYPNFVNLSVQENLLKIELNFRLEHFRGYIISLTFSYCFSIFEKPTVTLDFRYI